MRYDETGIENAAAKIAEQARRLPEPTPQMKYAACRFCGQFQDLANLPLPWGTDYIEYATEHCNCPEAGRYAEQKARERRAKLNREYALLTARMNIDEAFPGAPDETRELLYQVAGMLYDRKIGKTVIAVSARIKATIFRTPKGKIRIQRNYSTMDEWEVKADD